VAVWQLLDRTIPLFSMCETKWHRLKRRLLRILPESCSEREGAACCQGCLVYTQSAHFICSVQINASVQTHRFSVCQLCRNSESNEKMSRSDPESVWTLRKTSHWRSRHIEKSSSQRRCKIYNIWSALLACMRHYT
jgi:hypothetical protein